VPRKYHRPPTTTTKRRKTTRKIPYEFGGPDEGAADVSIDSESLEEGGEDEAPLAAVNVATASLAPAATVRSGMAGKMERHVTVDYSYVRGEVVRIAAIFGFLVIALLITSIFR